MSVRDELRARLGAMREVRFALLFGSRVRGGARPESDGDVAVFLDDDLSPEQRFRMRVRLATELEELGPVDLVVLNDADPLLARGRDRRLAEGTYGRP